MTTDAEFDNAEQSTSSTPSTTDAPALTIADLVRTIPDDIELPAQGSTRYRYLHLLIEQDRARPEEPVVIAICLTQDELFRRHREHLDQVGPVRAESVTLTLQAFPIEI